MVRRIELSQWGTEVRALILLALFTLGGGLWSGSYLSFFTLGILVALAWYLYWSVRLRRLLAAGTLPPGPKAGGLMQGLLQRVSDLQQRVEQQERYNTQVVSLFRRAFEQFPDAVLILGKGWQIQWCNNSGRQMLGLDPDVARHGSLVELVGHPVLEEYLAAGDFSRPLELESPSDRSRIMSMRLTPLPEDDGLVLLVARDITRLYHLDQMRRDFVANVSHELKTPLTVIGGYLESMHGDGPALPQHWRRPVELMHQQSERMRGIVDDLLLLSRLDLGQDGFVPVEVDVPGLLRDIVVNARVLAQPTDHSINMELDPGLGLRGEHKVLESLFSNLIINAVHHTPRGTRVEISWQQEAGVPVFMVQDSGDGIPARHLSHLTEPFYRVDSDRSRDSGGTGLGLSIVKRSLARHRGELRISSEAGQGARFRCEFPRELCCRVGQESGEGD
jgi:two-component system, OmpR family, phosphate regulon sensor histidine kinase PhoR